MEPGTGEDLGSHAQSPRIDLKPEEEEGEEGKEWGLGKEEGVLKEMKTESDTVKEK